MRRRGRPRPVTGNGRGRLPAPPVVDRGGIRRRLRTRGGPTARVGDRRRGGRRLGVSRRRGRGCIGDGSRRRRGRISDGRRRGHPCGLGHVFVTAPVDSAKRGGACDDAEDGDHREDRGNGHTRWLAMPPTLPPRAGRAGRLAVFGPSVPGHGAAPLPLSDVGLHRVPTRPRSPEWVTSAGDYSNLADSLPKPAISRSGTLSIDYATIRTPLTARHHRRRAPASGEDLPHGTAHRTAREAVARATITRSEGDERPTSG